MEPYELIRSGRKTLALEITRDCRVVVRARQASSNDHSRSVLLPSGGEAFSMREGDSASVARSEQTVKAIISKCFIGIFSPAVDSWPCGRDIFVSQFLL